MEGRTATRHRDASQSTEGSDSNGVVVLGRSYDISGPGILHTSPGAGAVDARLGRARPPPRFIDRTVPGRSVSPVHDISRLGRNGSPSPAPHRPHTGRVALTPQAA